MKITDLFEDVNQDRDFREEATIALDAVIDRLKRHGMENAHRFTMQGEHGKYFYLSTLGNEFKQYGRLRIGFIKHPEADNGNMDFLGGYSRQNEILIIFIDPNDTDGLSLGDRHDWYETFVHEFIHYLDYTHRIGDKADHKHPRDQSEYFNSPLEFNAFYQQAVYTFEDLIARMKERTAPERFTKMLNLLVPTVEKFISFVMNRLPPQVTDSLNDVYMRKFKKRLAAYYVTFREEYLI